MFNSFRNLLGVFVALPLFFGTVQSARAFQHPGIPLTVADLDNVKTNLSNWPWSDGYSQLASDYRSQLSYTMQGPFEYVARNQGGVDINLNQWRNDMIAVWNLSRMWYFTTNTAYAQKARDILVAWSNTQTNFGGQESGLDLGDYAYRFAGGADILRGTWPGWTAADTLAVSNLFANVYIPGSGGSINVLGPSNKGALQLAATLACAVFNDNTNLFNHALNLFRNSASSGLHYNALSSGQMGETGRDQGHAYNHLLMMTFMAEVFYKQGVDVYSDDDNRLLACGEYWSRNNMDPPAAYITFGTTDEIYWYNSLGTAGNSAGGYFAAEPMMGNLIRSAYVVRKGLTAPWTVAKRFAAAGTTVVNAQGENMNSFMYLKTADASVATPPTPIAYPASATATTGLAGLDIGSVGVAGSSSYSGGTWTVTGGGAETWTHGADSFRFVYKAISGDATIIARVNSVQNTAGTAKAGVMIRNSLSSSASQRAWVAITASSTIEAYNHGWNQIYGGSNWETFPRNGQSWRYAPTMPYWVKIERLGNTISTYVSRDGTSWEACTVAYYTGLPSTTYIGLFVCALNTSTANTSTFSHVSVTGGNGGNITIPPAPYAIYAAPDAGRVPLRWLQSFGATNYTVWRSTTDGGPYTSIASVTNASYVDTNVAPNTTYYYVIKASNSAGTSTNSPQDSATTQPTPPAPARLNAFPGNARATLVWTPSSGATSYNVKRSTTSGGPYVPLVPSVPSTDCTDTGLVNGTTYYYVVSAVNAAGEGTNSPEAAVTPNASAAALFWSGAVSGTWDTATANWLNGGASATFATGNSVIFDDSASSNTTISLSANRSPGTVFFNNASKNYSIGGSAIAGTGKLVKENSGALTLNNANTYSGGSTIYSGTVTVGNNTALGTGTVTLSGGTLFGGSSGFTLANAIQAQTNTSSVIDCSGNLTLNGNLTGGGTITRGSSAASSLYLGGNNSGFTGTYQDQNNGNSITRWTSANAGSANARWIFNQAQIASRTTPNFGTGTIQFGSISGGGYIYQNSSGTATLQVGALGLNDTFAGSMQDGAGTIALTKVGTGTLTLTGANTYTGPTAVNAGALVISTTASAKGNYSVANNATLAVNNVSSSSALVSNLTVAAGSTLEFQNVASTTVPLVLASNVTVSGTCTVKITGTNGLVAGSSYPLVSYAGTLSGTFTNLHLQMPYGWRGTLAQVGKQIVLTNVAVVATTSPQMNALPGGGQLQLDWPATHTGWRLLMQTNNLASGISSNTNDWGAVANSQQTNQMILPVNPSQPAVFYRLVYP
jgi:autotransporter-associated beta strand protein